MGKGYGKRSDSARAAALAALSLAVHGGLGKGHKGTHDWVSSKLNQLGFQV